MPLLRKGTTSTSAAQIFSRCPYKDLEIDFIQRNIAKAIDLLSIAFWLIATLGLSRMYYTTKGFVPKSACPNTLPIYVVVDDGRFAKWRDTVRNLNNEWRLICLGCVLILSLSVALLQIDSTLQNAFGRTTAIMTFIFSGAGLVLAVSFRMIITRPKKRKCPNGWIEASVDFNTTESVKFWSLLAMPSCLLIWSIIFCTITILTLPWNVQNGGSTANPVAGRTVTSTGNIISGVFLTTLAMMVIGPVYRAVKFARKLY